MSYLRVTPRGKLFEFIQAWSITINVRNMEIFAQIEQYVNPRLISKNLGITRPITD